MFRGLNLGVALVCGVGVSISAADWPQWRGPHGTGATDERNLPVRWSATENVRWKTDLGGVGVSSPIVAANRVFVTSQLGAGRSRVGPRLAQGGRASVAGERGLSTTQSDRTFLLVEAFDRIDGKRQWQYRVEAAG